MDVAAKLPGGQQRAAVHLQPFLRFFHRFQARKRFDCIAVDVCMMSLSFAPQLSEDNSIEAKMARSLSTASKMTMTLQLERMVRSSSSYRYRASDRSSLTGHC